MQKKLQKVEKKSVVICFCCFINRLIKLYEFYINIFVFKSNVCVIKSNTNLIIKLNAYVCSLYKKLFKRAFAEEVLLFFIIFILFLSYFELLNQKSKIKQMKLS
jgi:hypothetical protein